MPVACTLVYSSYCVSINAGVWPNPEMFAAIFPPKRIPPVGFLARCSHGVFLDLAGLRPVRTAYYILTYWIGSPSSRPTCQSEHATHLCPCFGYLSLLFMTTCLDGRGRREAREGWIRKGAKGEQRGVGWGWVYVCVPMLIILCSRGFEKMKKKKKE